MSRAAVEMVVASLDERRKLTSRSVFVDFGCSMGGVCLYVAQRFDCQCYGMERETELVRLARQSVAAQTRLSRLCSFVEADFESFAIGSWLDRIGATHVLAYDKVFTVDAWNALFRGISECSLVLCGIVCAQKKDCRLPDSFRVVGAPTRPVMLVGGKSGYRMRVWQTGQTL